jgi:2-methylaconitate isomerase
MVQERIRAVFMRGGTSNAVVLRQEDLPADRGQWDSIFLRIMGSPDPNGRQLDGMGGGISSLSKVCVVGPPTRPDADVDYTFAQVAVRDAFVDYSGNCGNMSAAIGPFAIDEKLVAASDGEAIVRIHNTNTSKIIVSHFATLGGEAAVDGELELDGVSGTGSPIRLEFKDPGGASTGTLLPTGGPRELLDVPGLGPIEASLVDAANSCVFIHAADLGKTGRESPDELEADETFLKCMEAVRRAASVAMGIAPTAAAAGAIASVPKVAMIAAPQDMATLSGRLLKRDMMDIVVRMISLNQPHRAVPLTGALCLAVAARLPGSLPHAMVGERGGQLRIAHPSGLTVVDAKLDSSGSGANGLRAEYAAVYRTARRLFEGHVLYRRSS